MKTIEQRLRDRIGGPAEVYINGCPKPFWGFVVDVDNDTLHLQTGGVEEAGIDPKNYFIRVPDISWVRIEPTVRRK